MLEFNSSAASYSRNSKIDHYSVDSDFVKPRQIFATASWCMGASKLLEWGLNIDSLTKIGGLRTVTKIMNCDWVLITMLLIVIAGNFHSMTILQAKIIEWMRRVEFGNVHFRHKPCRYLNFPKNDIHGRLNFYFILTAVPPSRRRRLVGVSMSWSVRLCPQLGIDAGER